MRSVNARIIEPELLDSLPPSDPAAIRSRADLRRVNWWMRNQAHVTRAIQSLPEFPTGILELGAGDGTFMLRVAEHLKLRDREVRLSLLDMEPVISPATLDRFAELGWNAEVIHANMEAWLERESAASFDLITANLFLHHFTDETLKRFFNVIARRCRAFIACEPRRWRPSIIGTRLLWCIGCNYVTRHDATVSVRAGFCERELSALWPPDSGFRLVELPAGLASHLLVATHEA